MVPDTFLTPFVARLVIGPPQNPYTSPRGLCDNVPRQPAGVGKPHKRAANIALAVSVIGMPMWWGGLTALMSVGAWRVPFGLWVGYCVYAAVLLLTYVSPIAGASASVVCMVRGPWLHRLAAVLLIPLYVRPLLIVLSSFWEMTANS